MFHTLMMGTAEFLSSKENIDVMAFMTSEVISMARTLGFKGIFTTNTNPLTQQFGERVFGYETINEAQVNKYTDKDRSRPFGKAPDAQKAVVMYKSLEK